MRAPFILVAVPLQIMFATAAQAVPGGQIDTMPTGRYTCETQGTDTSLVSVHIPEDDFRVRLSSSYSVDGKRGSYLLTGDRLVMTGGPFQGREFQRISEGSLRRLNAQGQPGDIICTLGSPRRSEADS